MYNRLLSLEKLVSKKSCFLLGPRQTGKSTLLKLQFPKARYIDLLEADTFRDLAARPELMRQRLQPTDNVIVIDEIQKLPALLDEVQLLIDRHKNLRFVLTGSSARKLKRGAANLLGGRARMVSLHPLVFPETSKSELEKRLNIGSLPGILTSTEPKEDLYSYVGTYLKEEIVSEGLSRSIGHFSRFLEVAALMNGEQLNYAAVGSDAQIPARTVRDHFQILEDTLVGKTLPVFGRDSSRKVVSTPKFYFFDVGVCHALRRTFDHAEGSPLFGKAFEHLIFCELDAWVSYTGSEKPLTYWRTRTQMEVDFVLGSECAIEAKAKRVVRSQDLRSLHALGKDYPKMRKVVVCLEPQRRILDGVEILPLDEFLGELWAGALVD